MKEAIEFRRLAQKHGVSYEKLNQDYRQKQTETLRIQKNNADSKTTLELLNAEIKQAELNLSALTSRIQKIMDLEKGMQKVGLDKLERIVRFSPAIRLKN